MAAKIRISEQNTKFIWVFSSESIFEELYTIVTNRDRHGGEGCLVAVVSGTKSEDVIKALEVIPEQKRETVQDVTLDLSDSMRRIVRSCFTKAQHVIDRFHIQKLACDAVQEMRIKHRWDAIQEANDNMENTKLEGHGLLRGISVPSPSPLREYSDLGSLIRK